MKSKRLIAILIMTIVSIVTPATYQLSLEPRIMANQCSVEINSIRLDESSSSRDSVVFHAYLRITNFEKVDVILSKLDLDVYYRIEGQGYRNIGKLRTNYEYRIPAATDQQNGLIESYYNNDNQLDYSIRAPALGYDEQIIKGNYFGIAPHVIANLTLNQEGLGSDLAVKDLVDGCLTLRLSGNAEAGGFTFKYENTITIEENLWDQNFIIADVFNYFDRSDLDYSPEYLQGSTDTDVNVIVVRAKMRNPSPIPMVLMDYTFNLTYKELNEDLEKEVVATGIPSDQLRNVYDPDYQTTERRRLIDVYSGGQTSIRLPGIDQRGPGGEPLDKWQDILLVFNFTDPNYPNQPWHPQSKTKFRINEFMESLFNQAVIQKYELTGSFRIKIGGLETTSAGIEANIGYDAPFRLDNTRFFQFPDANLKTMINIDGIEYRIGGGSGFDETDYERYVNYVRDSRQYNEPVKYRQPIALRDLLSLGEMQVSDIDINRSQTGYIIAQGEILDINDNIVKLNVSDEDIDGDNLHVKNTYLKIADGPEKGNEYLIIDSREISEDDGGVLVKSYEVVLNEDLDISSEGVSLGTSFNAIYSPIDIKFDITSQLTYENPYRIRFNITELSTNYYRSSQSQTSSFGDGKTHRSNQLVVEPTFVLNPDLALNEINPSNDFNTTLTLLSHEISLSYNALDFEDEGITHVLNDIGINPMVVNYSNPLWLLGTDGIKDRDGNNLDETELLKYLILNGIDPLMLLDKVNTSFVHYYGDNAYYPLEGSFFGTNAKFDTSGRPINNNDDPRVQSVDFFVTESGTITGGGSMNNIYYPHTATSDQWSNHPFTLVCDDENDATFRSQYDIFKRASGSWSIPQDWDLPSSPTPDYSNNLVGFITHNLVTEDVAGFRLSTNDLPDQEDVIWNIYSDSNADHWGLFYDHEYYVNNWYMIKATGSQDLLFTQSVKLNATADVDLDYNDYKIHSSDEIESATLSISYRYPQGTTTTRAGFGLSYFNYESSTPLNNNTWIFSGDYNYGEADGYPLVGTRSDTITIENSKSYNQWKRSTVDVTDVIKTVFENYEEAFKNGVENAEDYLFMEIQFGARSGVVYFDDIVLQIDYRNEREEPFRLKDLFKYIEDNAPVEGNLYQFMDSVGIDPIRMMGYLESNPPVDWNSEYSPDLTRYLKSSDTSIKNMISVMNDRNREIGAGEGLSFLEMLNISKYGPVTDPATAVQTPYGPRNILRTDEDGWVIKDPLHASQQLVKSLQNEIYTNDFGQIIQGQYFGKELWLMLENLGVTVPDILLYLSMNGWSNDDIFDLLEALGFGRMTKRNYRLEVQTMDPSLEIRQLMNYYSRTYTGGLISLNMETDTMINVSFVSNTPLDPSVLRIYQYLCSEASSAESALSLIHTEGQVVPLNEYSIEPQQSQATITFLGMTVGTVTATMEGSLTLHEFEVNLDLRTPFASRIAPSVVPVNNPFMARYGNKGLNDIGSSFLTQYLRQTIEVNQNPFIQYPGNVIELFKFLDEYFFTQSQYYLPYHQEFNEFANVPREFDYTSLTMLKAFDVSGKDFIDIITGYDQFTGTFDPNGNGRADDWTAPQGSQTIGGYGWDNNTVPRDANNRFLIDFGSGGGWGTDVKKNRLYWNQDEFVANGNQIGEHFGKIIWSDSPPFLQKGFSGQVTDPNLMYSGAPPIVDLIDMLLWLSFINPNFNAEVLFDWLLGELDYLHYTTHNYDLYGQVIPQWSIKRGLGLQSTWDWLENSHFNVSGMVRWLEEIKGVDSYQFLYQMQKFDGIDSNSSPDPNALFYFIRNPNFMVYADGTKGFVQHDALGATQTEAIRSYWNFFNGSWWNEQTETTEYWNTNINTWTSTLPGSILYEIMLLEEITGNGAFNIFNILENLGVKPDDWWNAIQEHGVLPIELLSVYDELDINQLLTTASLTNKKTRLKINGSFNLNFFGLSLYSQAENQLNSLTYEIGPLDVYVSDHLVYFIDSSTFGTSAGNFRIYS